MMIRVLLIASVLFLFSCTDNNDSNNDTAEKDMSQDMVNDTKNDMPPQGCMRDGMSYMQGEEVCLGRQLFKCDNSTLVNLEKACGEPFEVDIQISNLQGMSGKIGGIDSAYVTGTLSNLGTMDAKNVECFVIFALEGDTNMSRVKDISGPLFMAGESTDFEIVKNTKIGEGRTAIFEYECTAENEDEEAKSIGNYKKITFTY